MATRQTNFRLPLTTIKHLQTMAKAEHRTMTSMVITLIELEWAKHWQEEATPAPRAAITRKQRAAAARQAKAQARLRKDAYENAPEDWTR